MGEVLQRELCIEVNAGGKEDSQTKWLWNYGIPYRTVLVIPGSFIINWLIQHPKGKLTTFLTRPRVIYASVATKWPRHPHPILLLAIDIANLLTALSIPTPVRSVIGLSQSSVASFAFAALYDGCTTKGVVACCLRHCAENSCWKKKTKKLAQKKSDSLQDKRLLRTMKMLWISPRSTRYRHQQ